MRSLLVRTAVAWHAWLAKHHASVPEIWLIFNKRHTGRPSIAYQDALDEALCFGWIDSLVKRLDDDRYARKFTPRKAGSMWSDINRRRYAHLKAAGRLMPAGIDRSPAGQPRATAPGVPPVTPGYIRTALRQHPAAWRQFAALPPSHRRQYVGWIDSAKRADTKARRLAEAIARLAAGTPLGLK